MPEIFTILKFSAGRLGTICQIYKFYDQTALPFHLMLIYWKSMLMAVYLIHYVIQIRDFEYSSEAQENRKQELEKLVQDQETFRRTLLQWCYTSYGEVILLLLLYSSPSAFIYIAYMKNRK